jgi:hypothetical protein
MAQLKRKSDTDFDVDKTVVVCAKGPSFDVFPEFYFPNAYTAALTTTCNSIDKPIDFLFFNDIEAFRQVKDEALDNVSNVICPLVLHENELPNKEYTSGYISVALESKDINIFTHRLKDQDFDFNINRREQDCVMLSEGRIHSVLDTALAWFISLGFYKFVLFGVSSDAEYSEDFGEGKEEVFTKRDDDWYTFNFAVTTLLLKNNGCKATLVKADKSLMGLNCQSAIRPTIQMI